jgi:hypothetical protein
MKTNIKRVKISFEFDDMTDVEFLSFSDGTVTGLTGNSKFSAPAILLATVTTQTNDARVTIGLIKSGQTTRENTLLLKEQLYKVKLSVIANGHYVEDTANELAAGDTVYAKELILSTGYKPAKDKEYSQRDFEVVETGIGWGHIRAKKQKNGAESHLYRYGIAPAKGIVPAMVTTIYSPYADIIIEDLPSGSVVGVQHAGADLASKIKRSGHPVFTHSNTDPYEWTDFIYFVVP